LPEGPEREALFAKLVAKSYANGEAMHLASTLEIDAVIDPAETRTWLAHGLASAKVGEAQGRGFIDTW
jgi:acetyl-CoA carboxylase carboxyltransferase component